MTLVTDFSSYLHSFLIFLFVESVKELRRKRKKNRDDKCFPEPEK